MQTIFSLEAKRLCGEELYRDLLSLDSELLNKYKIKDLSPKQFQGALFGNPIVAIVSCSFKSKHSGLCRLAGAFVSQEDIISSAYEKLAVIHTAHLAVMEDNQDQISKTAPGLIRSLIAIQNGTLLDLTKFINKSVSNYLLDSFSKKVCVTGMAKESALSMIKYVSETKGQDLGIEEDLAGKDLKYSTSSQELYDLMDLVYPDDSRRADPESQVMIAREINEIAKSLSEKSRALFIPYMQGDILNFKNARPQFEMSASLYRSSVRGLRKELSSYSARKDQCA